MVVSCLESSNVQKKAVPLRARMAVGTGVATVDGRAYPHGRSDEFLVRIPTCDRNLTLVFQLTGLLNDPQLNFLDFAEAHRTEILHLFLDEAAHQL